MRQIVAGIAWLLFSVSLLAQDRPSPVLSHALLPQYPKVARSAHVTGAVRVAFKIDSGGNVGDIEFLSGPPLLRSATEENIRSWKFEQLEKSMDAGKFESLFTYRITDEECPKTAEEEQTLVVTFHSFRQVEIVTARPICAYGTVVVPTKQKKKAEE